jgi:hypothetical protein
MQDCNENIGLNISHFCESRLFDIALGVTYYILEISMFKNSSKISKM